MKKELHLNLQGGGGLLSSAQSSSFIRHLSDAARFQLQALNGAVDYLFLPRRRSPKFTEETIHNAHLWKAGG